PALLSRLRGRGVQEPQDPAAVVAAGDRRRCRERVRRRAWKRSLMANRKLIRPDLAELKKDGAPRSLRRKQSPPEQTNAEEFYYLKQMAAKTPMVVVLVNGEELHGSIEWY